jgi:hypothetical protein
VVGRVVDRDLRVIGIGSLRVVDGLIEEDVSLKELQSNIVISGKFGNMMNYI